MRHESGKAGWWACLLLLSIVAAFWPSRSGWAADEDTYVVQPGDTCLGIINKIGWRVTLEELHELNPDVYHGPPPHHLEPGTVLRLTRGPVQPDAHLTFVKPLVETRKPGAAFWNPGRVGLDLYRRYRVATREGATTEVTFRDTSRVQLREESLLVIYGASAERSRRTSSSARVELVEGRLRGGLAALRGESAMAVDTPAAEVSARSRDLQVEVDQARTTRLSVYDGEADIAAQGARVTVPRGQGTITRYGKRPEPPRPLPPPPRWTTKPRTIRIAFDGAKISHTFSWEPEPGARTFEVELARDPDFRDLFVDRQVPAKVHSVQIESLEPGRYFARVSSRDDRGLQGEASEPRELVVLAASTTGCRATESDRFVADWHARIALDRTTVPLEARVDGRLASPDAVSVQGPGEHTVSVRLLEEGFEPISFQVKVRDIRVSAVLSGPIPAAGGWSNLEVSAVTDEGDPVMLDPAWVTLVPSPDSPLEGRSDGAVVARFEADATESRRTFPVHVYLNGDTAPRVTLELVQEGPPVQPGRWMGGARAGVVRSFSSSGTGWAAGVDAGYQLPAVHPHLVLGLEADLVSEPGEERAGGETEPAHRAVDLGASVSYVHALGHGLGAHLGGAYVASIKAESGGEDTSPVASGLAAFVGIAYHLGPGEAYLELRYHYMPGEHGEGLPGTAWSLAGYRLFFGSIGTNKAAH